MRTAQRALLWICLTVDLVCSATSPPEAWSNVPGVGSAGTLTTFPRTDLSVGQGPAQAAIVDLNGDGHEDIAVVELRSQDVAVLLGNGNGTFQPPAYYAVPGTAAISITAADFNGDLKTDLAVISNDAFGTVAILLGTGTGAFTLHTTMTPGVARAGSL